MCKRRKTFLLTNDGNKTFSLVDVDRNSPEGVIGTGLCGCSILSLPDDVLLLTGLSGILFPCESMIRPLLLRTRDDGVLCSVCCLMVEIDCVVVFDDTHKPDKSILEPRDSRSRRILSLSI